LLGLAFSSALAGFFSGAPLRAAPLRAPGPAGAVLARAAAGAARAVRHGSYVRRAGVVRLLRTLAGRAVPVARAVAAVVVVAGLCAEALIAPRLRLVAGLRVQVRGRLLDSPI